MIIQPLDYLCIPAAMILGIVTSIDDIRMNKIRNRHIAIALAYSVLAIFITGIATYLSGYDLNWKYLLIFSINAISSLALGVIFWVGGLWSAGDSKLFFAYSCLIPLTAYQWGILNFPSYVILVNTFVPAFIYFFIRMIARLNLPSLTAAVRAISIYDIVEMAVYFFGFSFAIIWLLRSLALDSQLYLAFIIIVVSFFIVKRILGKFLIYAGIALSIVRLLAGFSDIQPFAEGLSLIAFFAIRLVMILGLHAFSRPVDVERLKPGMRLAEDIVKTSQWKYSAVNPMQKKHDKKEVILLLSKDKLTEKDIVRLKELHSGNYFESHTVLVKEEMPFALLLFFGVLLTIAFRGNVLSYIVSFIRYYL